MKWAPPAGKAEGGTRSGKAPIELFLGGFRIWDFLLPHWFDA